MFSLIKSQPQLIVDGYIEVYSILNTDNDNDKVHVRGSNIIMFSYNLVKTIISLVTWTMGIFESQSYSAKRNLEKLRKFHKQLCSWYNQFCEIYLAW